MDSRTTGTIDTAFVTSKLPTWAGVRQNIVGSNIHGAPVTPSNSLTYVTDKVEKPAAFALQRALEGRPEQRLQAVEFALHQVLETLDSIRVQLRQLQHPPAPALQPALLNEDSDNDI